MTDTERREGKGEKDKRGESEELGRRGEETGGGKQKV